MSTLIAAGAGVLTILAVVWLVWRFGKSAGGSAHEASRAEVALETERRMDRAGADAPADLKAVEAALRRGEF